MTFDELVVYMGHYRARHPSQRAGQAYFNALHEKLPDIANEIRSTEDDPFYDDRLIKGFLTRVGEALA